MPVIFRMCGNESQPGLQLVKKLATPLVGKNMWERQPGLGVHFQFCEHTDGRHPTSSAIQEHTKATGPKISLDRARILTRRKNLVTKKIRDVLQIVWFQKISIPPQRMVLPIRPPHPLRISVPEGSCILPKALGP